MSSNHRDGKDYNHHTLHKCAKCGAYSRWEGYCSMVCMLDSRPLDGSNWQERSRELSKDLDEIRKDLRGRS